MKFIFTLLFGMSLVINAQISLSTYQPDFGLITKKGDRFVDISIKNNTDKKEFIFRIDAPKEYTINFSSKTLEPDSIRTIRIKYNPKQKGLFSHELKLHLSNLDVPQTITTKGFVEDFNENSSPLCPSFRDKDISKETSFELEVLVVEKYSQQPIRNANVTLIQNGNIKYKLVTDGKGLAVREVPLGLYYTVATAQNYSTDEFMAYVNRNNNYLKYELERKSPVDVPADTTDFEEEIVIVTTPPELPPVDIPDSLIIEDVPEMIDDSDFSVNKFAANNIVFCVDISASMKYTGRLDLLKASMISLTNLLRPVDNITIVAYASEASVIMETTSAGNKEEIIKVIEQLEASGNTAGIEGMKLAYSKACNAYIDGGNNEVIMATDGGFNKGEGSTKKLAKKYAKRKIEMSIVGIKVPNNKHVESMRSVAGIGNGVFIPIKNYEQAQYSLVEEIKRQSLITK